MDFRPINSSESLLLDKLLSVNFNGQPELIDQTEKALVRTIDENGSLRFSTTSNLMAIVNGRIPVEAQCLDLDNVVIHALLHVIDGRIWELEIYRDDSLPEKRSLDAVDWEVSVLNNVDSDNLND
jgi:hypothetical protein